MLFAWDRPDCPHVPLRVNLRLPRSQNEQGPAGASVRSCLRDSMGTRRAASGASARPLRHPVSEHLSNLLLVARAALPPNRFKTFCPFDVFPKSCIFP